jgi:hypothetical protein
MKTSLIPIVVFLSYAALTAKCQTADEAASKKASQEAEIPKSIFESVGGTMQYAEGNLLGLAEAMPEDKYSFIPTKGKFEGVRSFGEQIKHVALCTVRLLQRIRGQEAARRL